MNPTMHLRFIERAVEDPQTGHVRVLRVLQQQFVADDDPEVIDWRDVPLDVDGRGWLVLVEVE